MAATAISLLFLTGLLIHTTRLSAESEQDAYVFVDAEGRKIYFPTDVPVYSKENPGPWRGEEPIHDIVLKIKSRYSGLEKILILNIKTPHPMDDTDEETGWIQEIFVLDKDDLIVGYHEFEPEDTVAKAKIWINGIINYVQIYIRCTRHGLWREEFRI